MPKRFTRAEHKRLTAILIERDGPRCRTCGILPEATGRTHTIDHIDNDRDNGDDANLQLLCRPCNTAKRNQRIAELARWQVTKEKEANARTHARTTDAGYYREPTLFDGDRIPTAVRLSRSMKACFANYVLDRLRREPGSELTDLILSGASEAGCTRRTATNYLEILASSTGCVDVYHGGNGVERAKLRT